MPTPIRWICPTDLSAEEQRVAQALHRIGKFYVFLREVSGETARLFLGVGDCPVTVAAEPLWLEAQPR
jgi:hypothetical protein